MQKRLHESDSLASSPCVGVCSTSVMPDDDRCKGCGRTVEEIRDWPILPDFQKKLINVRNWLEDYNIRQKAKIRMSDINKIDDINGRMTTIIAIMEMIAKDMLEEFGKDESIKDSYKALYESRKEVLKAKQSLPQSK
tara:strand:+ start:351 stop:761 length:411 start_codon:yes stop_codon:yes gene_type:complete